MPRGRRRSSPMRPATAPLKDPSPTAAQAAPVAVAPPSQVAPHVSSSIIHAVTDNVAQSRSSSSSSGSSATIHLEPHYSAAAVANAIALVSRLRFTVRPLTYVVHPGSATPALPPQPTSALHNAISIHRAAHDVVRVSPDAIAGAAYEPLSSMPGKHLKLPTPPVPSPRPQYPPSMVAAASTNWDAANRDTVLCASSRPRFTEAPGMII